MQRVCFLGLRLDPTALPRQHLALLLPMGRRHLIDPVIVIVSESASGSASGIEGVIDTQTGAVTGTQSVAASGLLSVSMTAIIVNATVTATATANAIWTVTGEMVDGEALTLKRNCRMALKLAKICAQRNRRPRGTSSLQCRSMLLARRPCTSLVPGPACNRVGSGFPYMSRWLRGG